MKNLALTPLSCPVCGAGIALTDDGKSLFCRGTRRHLFDFSSSGYVNLYTSHTAGGDSAECIAARHAFLSRGYYKNISDEINLLINKYAKKPQTKIVDAGCGEGFYTLNLARMGDNNVYGFDLSKAGVNTAAKSARREGISNIFLSVASVFALPLADKSVDAVTSIFAPCAEEEFARILDTGGVLILAGAGRDHLLDLKKAIYDDAYENEGRRDLPKEKFTLLEEKTLSYDITLETNEEIMSLFAMTPYYYRTSVKDTEKLHKLSSLCTKVEVEFYVYGKR